MTALAAFVADALARPVAPGAARMARRLGEEAGASAVLFYGSVLRTGDADGILDFYVLTPGPAGARARLWPDVSYREMELDGTCWRAKVATMPLAAFAAAAEGRRRDTTIWARFVQPAALVWSRDEAARASTVAAVAAATVTAARVAALVGPADGTAADYWRALFRATYATELRFERSGREHEIVDRATRYFEALLLLAWREAGIEHARSGTRLSPVADTRVSTARYWRRARRSGRALNVARLVKAAFTFEGAGRYALWKVSRHTGVPLALTPWRERHPILAAPGVLWTVWRARSTR